jgi:hypothetical protein
MDSHTNCVNVLTSAGSCNSQQPTSSANAGNPVENDNPVISVTAPASAVAAVWPAPIAASESESESDWRYREDPEILYRPTFRFAHLTMRESFRSIVWDAYKAAVKAGIVGELAELVLPSHNIHDIEAATKKLGERIREHDPWFDPARGPNIYYSAWQHLIEAAKEDQGPKRACIAHGRRRCLCLASESAEGPSSDIPPLWLPYEGDGAVPSYVLTADITGREGCQSMVRTALEVISQAGGIRHIHDVMQTEPRGFVEMTIHTYHPSWGVGHYNIDLYPALTDAIALVCSWGPTEWAALRPAPSPGRTASGAPWAEPTPALGRTASGAPWAEPTPALGRTASGAPWAEPTPALGRTASDAPWAEPTPTPTPAYNGHSVAVPPPPRRLQPSCSLSYSCVCNRADGRCLWYEEMSAALAREREEKPDPPASP